MTNGDACPPGPLVTPQDVKAMLDRGDDFVLLDCREADETDECVIAGARCVPMKALSLHLDDLREHEETTIVVYCRTGSRAAKVASTLRQLGFADVRFMEGGLARWATDVDPSVSPG